MKKTLIDRYEELVPGTKDRLDKSDEEKSNLLLEALKKGEYIIEKPINTWKYEK